MKIVNLRGCESKDSICIRSNVVAEMSLVLLLGTFSPSPAAGEPLFAAPSLGFKMESSGSVAAGDLDLDGAQDLVTSTYGGTVSVLLGNGDGTFGVNRDYGAGGRGALAIGDLNGDGKPDLALVTSNDPEPGSVLVMLGNGDGTFGPSTNVASLAGSGGWLAITDLNGDGELDLAVTSRAGDVLNYRVSVLLGYGDGTFGPKTDVATFGSGSLAIADLNGDGKPDLVVANYVASSTVSVLLGIGDGTFGVKSDYVTADLPISAAIGDLNADGKLDLAVASPGYDGYSGGVSVLLGNGDGTFRPKSVVGPLASSVAIVDLNRDGKLDLLTNNRALLGNGDGTFGQPIPGGGQLVEDLNGDGNVDVVRAGQPIPFVFVALGNGDGTFGGKGLSYERRPLSGELIPNVAIGDLNGDGRPDLATPNPNTDDDPGTVSVVLGHGDGTFGPKSDYATGFFSTSAAIGDLNGDGKQDLVVSGADHVSVLLGNEDGTIGPKRDFEIGFEPHFVAIGDLNGDGNPDVVTANYSAMGVSVLLGNGDGTLRPRIDNSAGGGYCSSLAIGDLSGDGKPDLAIATGNCCGSTIRVLIGNGDGTFRPSSDVEAGYIPKSVAMGDLNRDGKQDLVTASTAHNRVRVLMGNGDGTFAAPTDYFANLNTGTIAGGQLVAIGDLDGDGKLDLAVTSSGTGVFVLLGNGDGTFEGNILYAASGGAVAIGDLNGDAKPDLVTLHEVLLNIGADPIAADFAFHPHALHLDAREKLVTGKVRLPAPFDASQIDVSSIRLNGVVSVSTARPPRIEGNGRALAVAFEWAEVKATLAPGHDVPVRIHGLLAGQRFSGTDLVNVRERGAGLAAGEALETSEAGGVENGAAVFALRPASPAGGAPIVSFSLASAAPASLTAYDVTGRQVATHAVQSSGPGWRTMQLGDFPAGLYLVRLSQGGRSLTARVAVLR